MVKKNMFKLQQIFFAVLVAGAIVSCDKENVPTQEPEFTPEYRIEAPQNEWEITKKEVSLLVLSK